MKRWKPDMTAEEERDLAYWERNMLALRYADGWYNDDVDEGPRFAGWRRVLTLDGGKITFHIPNDFDVGTLPQVERNWDGHSTVEKWKRIAKAYGIT